MSQILKFICIKVSIAMAFLLFFQASQAQYNFSGLDALLEQKQAALGKNAAVLVYTGGKTVYTKEMGDFKINTPAPIASCSKWLTAALVMQFVDEGKLSLDDKVGTYLPIFNNYNKGYITIRHCLAHLTGIQSEQGLAAIIRLSRYNTLEEEVNDFASKKEIQANAGTEFRYSSVGLNIAGRVLEVISHKPFEKLMLERIFRPLGMKNSSFAGTHAVNPSGGAISTASDYVNFLVMLLNKGEFNGKRILSEQSVQQMQTAQTSLGIIKYAPKVAEGYNYGLGEWILETDAAGKTIAVSSPGLFGTWPILDIQRTYAAIVFVKSLLNEDKKEVYLEVKKKVDEQIALP